VPVTQANKQVHVKVWKDDFDAYDQGDDVALWLRAVLGFDCRLVHMSGPIRKVDQKYSISENDYISFADAYPILLTTDGSLNDCNSRLQEPIPMNRFRPNFVISGCTPFEEDTWKTIRIGEMVFELVKPCSRCVTVNIDQKTAHSGLEPLKILSTYRKSDGKIMFGQNVIHRSNGEVSIGQNVEVLDSTLNI
jgi:uncharacterized protein